VREERTGKDKRRERKGWGRKERGEKRNLYIIYFILRTTVKNIGSVHHNT
jgi:hypothetical protein